MQKRQSPEHMRALLAKRETLQLTTKALAEQSGISTYTLHYWARKFREKKGASSLPAIIPVRLTDPTAQSPLRIELSSGMKLIVEAGFDESHLLHVIEVLERAC